MDRHDFDIPITFKHRVIFTRDAFAADNSALANVLIEGGGRRVLVFIENTVAASWKNLPDHIQSYFEKLDFDFRGVKIFAGGEACKADENLVREVWREIDTSHIDRHSYVIAIGGGAFLDAVGY
ncbi:MAG: 3-dehydroquinate synthase, partial [Akkermansiaceae bacterium]